MLRLNAGFKLYNGTQSTTLNTSASTDLTVTSTTGGVSLIGVTYGAILTPIIDGL